MIDPKVLLEALLAGAAKPGAAQQQPAQAATAVDLGEVLRRLGGAQGADRGGGGAASGGGDGGGLADILEKLGRAAQQGQAPGGRASAPQQPRGGQDDGPLSGGLGDILGEIFGRGGQPAPRQAETRQPSGMPSETTGRGGQGGGDLLEEIFGKQASRVPQAPSAPAPQAPRAPQTPWGQGARPGAVVDARARAEELLSALAAGRGTPEMIAELQQMVANGQLNASAVIGGLGSVIVGNKPGRRISAEAVSIGGLELIGAIAYASYVGYQQDRGGAVSRTIPNAPAPRGSGFEPEAQTSDTVLLYVRAMIAAAMADGEIDPGEQQKLVAGLQRLGLGQHAAQFLQQEIESPQSIDELVQAATTPAVALQVYVASRLAIEPDTRDEQAFLQALAQGLGIDESLAAHIDAQTTALKA